MLILARRPEQTIHIGDRIEVKIKTVIGHQVWLEVITPSDTPVQRGEIYKPEKRLEEQPICLSN